MAAEGRAYKALGALLWLQAAAIIVFGPLAFGAVHVWARSLLELIAFCMLITVSAMAAISGGIRVNTNSLPAMALAGLFMFSCMLQLVPLPAAMLSAVTPGSFHIYNSIAPSYDPASTWRMSAVNSDTAIGVFRLYAAYLCIFVSVLAGLDDRNSARRLLALIVITAFAEALYGIYVHLSGSGTIYWFSKPAGYVHGASGTFVNRNHFAAYLSIASLAGLGMIRSRLTGALGVSRLPLKERIINFIDSPRALSLGASMAAMAATALGIAFSLSRAGLVCFLAAALFMAIVRASRHNRKRAAITVLIAITLAAAGLVASPLDVQQRLQNTKNDFTGCRLPVWDDTLSMSYDFPVTGAGAGTFGDVFRIYKRPGEGCAQGYVAQAHNDYLQMAAESGFPALAALVAFAAYLLRAFLKATGRRDGPLALGAAGALLYMALHSMVDFSMQIPAIAATMALVMSITLRLTSGNGKFIPLRFPVAAISATLALTLAYGAITAWRTEAAFPVQSTFINDYAGAEVKNAKQLQRLTRAMDMDSGKALLYGIRARYNLSVSMLESTGEPERIAMQNSAVSDFSRALDLNPAAYENLSYLSQALSGLGRIGDAFAAIQRGMRLNPGDPYLKLAYARLSLDNHDTLAETGQPEADLRKALEMAREASDLNTSLIRNRPAVALRTELLLALGDMDEAVREIRKIGPLNEETITYHLMLAEMVVAMGKSNDALRIYERTMDAVRQSQTLREAVLASAEAAVDYDGSLIRIKHFMAREYIATRRYKKTLELLEGASGNKPEQAETLYLGGMAYEGLGDPKKAEASYLAALRLNPRHEKASARLGDMLRQGQALEHSR